MKSKDFFLWLTKLYMDEHNNFFIPKKGYLLLYGGYLMVIKFMPHVVHRETGFTGSIVTFNTHTDELEEYPMTPACIRDIKVFQHIEPPKKLKFIPKGR